ncbi:MAG: hypothetical protein ACRER7_03870, partial [Gammaproteobacteria bacterium]
MHASTRRATTLPGLRVAHARVTQTRLRQYALRIEARRVALPHATARAAPAPQPLYAAQVETPQGNLISAQQAVAAGLLNPYALAAHTRKTSTTSRYTVNYIYDAHEHLSEVVDAANPELIYWQATSGNAFGQLTGALLGNGVINTYGFDPNTGQLQTLKSGVGISPGIAYMSYQWDADGNLHLRTDNNANLTETFTNDALNRLTQAQISGATSSTLTLGYDVIGNIQSKSDVGTYHYSDPMHPQQITSLTPNSGPVRSFSYDADGNLVNDGVHANTFDALNRVTAIQNAGANAAVQIAYTPDGARYQETTSVGASSTTLTEVNP